MTNYELLEKHLPVINKLVQNNLIHIDIFKQIEIYERFHSLTGLKKERYRKLSEELGITPLTVQRTVLKLSKPVK